jgi:hypothetical protein
MHPGNPGLLFQESPFSSHGIKLIPGQHIPVWLSEP